MRIFVGSSTRQVALSSDKRSIDAAATAKKPIGRLVAALRKKKGLVVEPWWEEETFQKSQDLLESVIEKARTCHGGIFVFGGDDLLTLEGAEAPIGVPRGNVILECGMFLAARGMDATYIVRDGPYENIYWPTDILGKLVPDLLEPNLAQSAYDFFIKTKPPRHNTTSEVYINDTLMQSIANRGCAKWSTKGLYLGAEAARRWTTIESGPSYLQRKGLVQDFVNRVHRDSSIRINFEAIDNIISLGRVAVLLTIFWFRKWQSPSRVSAIFPSTLTRT